MARHLARWGVPVIDADQLAREVVALGTEGLAAVVARFGVSFLDNNGALDRKKLGEHVFARPEERRALEELVIPRIAALSMARFEALGAKGARWAIYEASLLVEQKTYKMFSALLVVTAQPEVQRARVMARDALPAHEVDARISAQLAVVRKVELAQHVVDNSGSAERLQERCAGLFHTLVTRLGPVWEQGHTPRDQVELGTGATAAGRRGQGA